jgi:hypothetical protein
MVTPNDVLRFFLELAALASLAYWGFSEFGGVVQWIVGLGAPLLAGLHLALTFALGQRPSGEVATAPPPS